MLSDLKGVMEVKPKADKKEVIKVALHIAKSAKGLKAAGKTADALQKYIKEAKKALDRANLAGLNKPEDFVWKGNLGANAKTLARKFDGSLMSVGDTVKVYSDRAEIVAQDMAVVAKTLTKGAAELSVEMYTHSSAIDKELPPAAQKLEGSAGQLKTTLKEWDKASKILLKDQSDLAKIVKGSKSLEKKIPKRSKKRLAAKITELEKSVTVLGKWNKNVNRFVVTESLKADIG